ncbi:Glypican-6 [Bagarius yarrelli]|uniref:Glypican-6 n=1 Tax=Bagarius yarrelli TaxID=175774 RepID=A0A556TK84_BAGYA|nr:Glypican-6 [Bagarius yarrelli]
MLGAAVSGEHLRVCSQEYTCCGVEMEDALTHRSKADLEHLMEESSSALRTVFTTKHRKFDAFLGCKLVCLRSRVFLFRPLGTLP